jgi:serine/threonine protein kinase
MSESATPGGGGEGLVGVNLGGKYQILRKLGEGSMGAVYEAEMEGGRRVAIKTLSPSARQAMGDEALSRFLREAEVSRSVKSENVVEVIEGSSDPDLDIGFIVMELMQGEDLDQAVTRLGALEPETAVRIIIQAARGLAAAHEQGIVHRDLKPSNIFLHQRGDDVIVKVCDFGVAKDASQQQKALTVTGSVLGSPLYMAPEQLLNARKVDWRADIWGLSITAFDALSGSPALDKIENLAMLVVAIVRQDIPSLSVAAPWLDPTLCDAVHKGLQREVDARYQQMSELAAALLPFAGGSEALTVDMLKAVDPERKARVKIRPGTPPPAVQKATSAPPADRGAERHVGHTIAKRYQLGKVLREGPDGYVYEAKTTSGRPCVLRIVPRPLLAAAGGSSKIIAGARAAREVRHPNVLRVLDTGDDPIMGVPYVVIEPISGKNLATLLKEKGQLDAKTAAHIFLHVAHGLKAIHESGAIHGEVRPSAIFLVDRGDGDEIVVTGWGEAKVAADEPMPPAPAGTEPVTPQALYMSPEQARAAREPDPRIDVWGLFLSLYEAVAGRHPFGGISILGDLILAVCMREVPPITVFAPGTPPALAEALRLGLQRNAQKRPATMDEVMALLAPIAGEPIPAPPPPEDGEAQINPTGATLAQPGGPGAAPPPARTSPVLIGVGVVAFMVVAGLGAKMALAPDTQNPPSQITPGARVAATVQIKPATAHVQVNGTAKPLLPGGILALEGHPGEVFTVLAVDGAQRTEVKVTLSGQGHASPSSLDLSGK